MARITLESIPIVVGREEDGRWWADIESMPGVMAYGETRELAIAAVRALALRAAADSMATNQPSGVAPPVSGSPRFPPSGVECVARGALSRGFTTRLSNRPGAPRDSPISWPVVYHRFRC
jgi:hypothetical protein